LHSAEFKGGAVVAIALSDDCELCRGAGVSGNKDFTQHPFCFIHSIKQSVNRANKMSEVKAAD
jgi:hypothetical protein